MKRISVEEASSLYKALTISPSKTLHREMDSLAVGEGLMVDREDFPKARGLTAVASHPDRKKGLKGFSYHKLPDRTGWLVVRTK